MNGEYYAINKEWVDYSLRADTDILQNGNSLKYYIADNDGQLPPGLHLSQTGRIFGYINDSLGVDINISASGGYDSDTYDSYGYDHSIISNNGQILSQPKTIKKIYQFYVTVTDGIGSSRRKFNIELVDHNSLRVDTSFISVDSVLFNVSASYLLSPIWQGKDGNKLPKVSNLGTVRSGKPLILDTFDYDPYPIDGPVFYDWNTIAVNPDISFKTDGNINSAGLPTTNLQGQNTIYYKNAELNPVKGMAVCFGDYIPNTDKTIYTILGVIPLTPTSGILNINQPLAQQIPDSKICYAGTLSQHPPGLQIDPNTGKLYGKLTYQPVYSTLYRFTLKIIKLDQSVGTTSLIDAIGSSSSRIINKIYTTLINDPPEGDGGLTPAVLYSGKIGDIWLVGQTPPPYSSQGVIYQELLPLMDGTLKAYVFTGPLNPTWAYIGEVASTSQIFLLNVLGNVLSSINFVSTGSLGTLTSGQISELSVNAINNGTNYAIEYEIVQGSLPPGVTFNSDGTIEGKVINFGQTYFDFTNTNHTTFDKNITSIDKNWNFTVRASDAYRLSSVEQQFSISVYQNTSIEYTRIYVKPFLSKEKRTSYKDFITDPMIFDLGLLYRPNDPEFGSQQQIKMIIETGIQKTNLDDYALAMNSYFYRKQFYFGDVKSIKAQDSNGKYVYDLIYVEIVDNQMNGNYSSTGSVSVGNMQYQLETISLSNQTIISVNDRLQPRFMTTLHSDTGIPIGFIKAVPICYTIPGGSVKILSRIYNAISIGKFNFNQYNFDTDRIIIETNSDTEQTGWVLYPTARQ